MVNRQKQITLFSHSLHSCDCCHISLLVYPQQHSPSGTCPSCETVTKSIFFTALLLGIAAKRKRNSTQFLIILSLSEFFFASAIPVYPVNTPTVLAFGTVTPPSGSEEFTIWRNFQNIFSGMGRASAGP